jgi:tetratricopeptide (TPR) repeat protein
MIEEYIQKYIETAEPSSMYDLAVEYNKIGQTASALTFYLMFAESCKDNDLKVYEALLHAGECFSSQGRREGTVRVLYHHAARKLKDRPEAYYLLSKNWSYNGDWQSALHFIELAKSNPQPDIIDSFSHAGSYNSINLQEILCLWNWGQEKEALNKFNDIENKEHFTIEEKLSYENISTFIR